MFQAELRQPKTIESNNNLTFINAFNPNNSKLFDLVKSGVNKLIENSVNGFKNISLIYAKRKPPNLKRILTTSNSLFTNKIAGIYKCSDGRFVSNCVVSNFYRESHIHLKTLVNNSY